MTMSIGLLAVNTSAGAYPPGTSPTLSLNKSIAVEGSQVVVTGANYAANERVTLTLHSAVSTLGTAQTDASGSFRTTVTLTAGVVGQHTITGDGATGDTASASILITAAGSGGGSGTGGGSSGGGGGLSSTGVAVISLGTLGLVLLLGGGMMLLAGRRRKATV
ncbi:MAG: hypothetical protein ACR2LX_07890 [Jatrophihabitans sp.]